MSSFLYLICMSSLRICQMTPLILTNLLCFYAWPLLWRVWKISTRFCTVMHRVNWQIICIVGTSSNFKFSYCFCKIIHTGSFVRLIRLFSTQPPLQILNFAIHLFMQDFRYAIKSVCMYGVTLFFLNNAYYKSFGRLIRLFTLQPARPILNFAVLYAMTCVMQ